MGIRMLVHEHVNTQNTANVFLGSGAIEVSYDHWNFSVALNARQKKEEKKTPAVIKQHL